MSRPVKYACRAFALVLAIIPFVGCADETTLVPEEPISLDAAKADAVDYDNWTYFIVTHQDMRRCVSPLCGGVYIRRLNQPTTKCVDGTWQKECYVGGFDFAKLGYSADEASDAMGAITSQQAVFRGAMTTGYYPGDFSGIPAFAATEVWVAANEKAPHNTFFRAHDTGIVCIAAPCASIDGLKLNKNAHPLARYAGVDLSALGLDEAQTAAAWDALHDDSLVIAGKAVSVSGAGGKAEALKASQIYFARRAKGGPSGQACGGRAGACPDGLYCQFTDALCGKADGQGTCQTPPTECLDDDAPVCGCDGVTYANDCYRRLAGAGFGTEGECQTDAACRIAGCSGELCVAADSQGGFSTCMWREEFACYQQAGVCETQADGACGWTKSDELTTCLSATSH